MKKLSFLILGLLIVSVSFGQVNRKLRKGNERRVNRIGTFEMTTQCMGVKMGSKYTVRAFGEGDNEKEALADAQFRAISDILFRGISKGTGGCAEKPLVFNPNLEEEKGAALVGELIENDKDLDKIVKGTNGEGRINSKKQSDQIVSFELEIDVSAVKSYFTNKGLINKTVE